MSSPGSNRNKKYDDRRSRQSDTITFNVEASGWAPEQHRRSQYQPNFDAPPPFPLGNLGATPAGPFPGTIPGPRSPSRYQKTPSYSATPGPYDGSGAVKRTPSHMSSPKLSNFPQELGGRPPASHPSQQPSYHTTPAVPRSPDGFTGQRISMTMTPRPTSTVPPPHASRPASQTDPRYPSNGRGY
ncbi:hypothetical protein B0H12DRAFT_84929 [Mycena haematopus]|nr:hypothetical protein B0H12DRAFT_84929 [Mycena haematopus]